MLLCSQIDGQIFGEDDKPDSFTQITGLIIVRSKRLYAPRLNLLCLSFETGRLMMNVSTGTILI